MSGTCLIFTGHRSAYKCIQQYCVSYFYKNVIKSTNVHSAMQYCISMKEDNVHLTKQSTTSLTNDMYNKEQIKKVTSNKFRKNVLTYKKLERIYQQPKNSLLEIYRIVCQELNDQTLLTSSCNADPKSQLWKFTYNIKWPENMSFNGVSKRKTVASNIAALKCLEWLETNHKLMNGKPILYTKKQIQNMQLKTHELSIAPEILDNMESLIKTYKMKIDIPRLDNSTTTYSCNWSATMSDYDAFGPLDSNIKTNYKHRNMTLQSRLIEKHTRHTDLPIFQFRDKILSMLAENKILLIEGDTGCGKSTQVPQFILDSYARSGNAVKCNILVSQPRKISAISLADRVANERSEILGDVVGYQVRLENVTPQESGRIVYCSTGILLRKLQCSPSLVGCSHVILDEAHERSIDTDILMILLKRALNLNPELKLLIMSATIKAHLFQKYFNCATIKVPGRVYPVEVNFMEDIKNLPNFNKYRPYAYQFRPEAPILNDLPVLTDFINIVQIIKWISANKPYGAILCFLPGWSEIMQVQKMFEDEPLSTQKQLILTIHSRQTHDAQRRIFQEVPKDTRKIILATNIAETGITIPDVCYVVDSAIRRVVKWNDAKDMLCLHNDWITKANIQQRKGRAGRMKPGESYHLIKRTEYDNLEEYPTAQILSSSLEKTILECKSYTDENMKIFFSNLIEPPAPNKIQKGVEYLINNGILDKDENLTALGKRMTVFTTHPRFSKALVYSAIFKCVHPVVTIANVFSGEESGFSEELVEKTKNRKNKMIYHPSSDHLAISRIFKAWSTYSIKRHRLAVKFCRKMHLRQNKMKLLSMTRDLFLRQMVLCRLLNNTHMYNDFDNAANKFEDKDELVKAIIYAATQQLIEHKNVGLKKGILRTGINELRVGKIKALISGDSVNYKRKIWPSSYLTYFRSEHDDMCKRMIIRETSMISPLTILLFNQQEIQCYERDDKIELKINVNKDDTLNFSCDKRTADVLLKFRNIMWSVVQYSLEKEEMEFHNYGVKLMSEYKDQLLETLVKALDNASECIQDTNDDNDNNDDDDNDDDDNDDKENSL
ncbi:ATP-dependent RNA helicase DHX30-like [Odontomachus brunneus]|uniref:ATP-dependent RNA helicase DHX30-like n=1 Tax=Odontomachus brunneus TaxID=486640 RepID=UPI0013F20825|nr:ATP-dependent RNA helicase DHX30-like [Odontomachus brunneus]XP_032669942.1 ATP-dependent RNA helicase DHX30-like [Odontomachus brunneus]